MCVLSRTDPSQVINAVAFFVAGMVLAVGSAFIYSSARGLRQPSEPVRPAVASRRAAVAESSPPVIKADQPRAVEQPGALDETPADETLVAIPPVLKRPKPVPHARRPPVRPPSPVRIAMNTGRSAPSPLAAPVPTQKVTYEAPREEYHASTPHPATPLGHTVTLEPGLAIIIRLSDKLSANYNSKGDTFRGTVDKPVIVNSFIIAEKGATVFGRIVYARKARLLGASDLSLALTDIHTTDGQEIKVQTSAWEESGARTNLGNAINVVDAAMGAVAGAVYEAARGAGISSSIASEPPAERFKAAKRRTVMLPPGTRLTFYLSRPLTLHEQLNASAGAMPPG